MATITGRFSISHDTLARSLFADDFLTKNPDFEIFKPDFEQCKNTYNDEVKKKGCSCRVDSSWATPCLDKVLATLDAATRQNHDLIRRFIRFISKRPDEYDVDGLAVNIIYADKMYNIFVDPTPPEDEPHETN